MQYPTYKAPALGGLTPGQTGGLSTAFNTDTGALKAALAAAQADNAQLRILLRMTGRIIAGADDTEGAPVPGDGLTVQVANATPFIVQGQPVVIDGEDNFFVVDLSDWANTDGVHVYLTLNEGGELTPAAFAAEQAGFVAAGKPLLGVFDVGSTSVDGPDDTLATKVRSYDQQQAGGGGGDGDESYDDSALRAAISALMARVASLESALRDAQGIDPTVQSPVESLYGDIAGLGFHVEGLDPNYARTARGSFLIDGVTGNSENSPSGPMPQVSAGGNEPHGDS